MKACSHSDWLTLRVQEEEIVLLESDRLHNFVENIPDPDAQQFSLIVLIGGAAKSSALQLLTSSRNGRKSTDRRAGIHLHLGRSSFFPDRVVLFADGDLPYHGTKRKSSSLGRCHETIIRTLPQIRGGAGELALDETADNLYSRLLCPFADVFCFFSADFGGFRSLVRCLASWLEKGQSSTLSKATYPRALVVVETTLPGIESEMEAKGALLDALKAETTKDLAARFSALDVVTVPSDGKISAPVRYKRLEEYLVKASDQVRMKREDTKTLFSTRHFAAFFRHACDHFARTLREPFDYIKASRLRNPVSVDLDKHLSNFLKQTKSAQELTEFAVPVIASSLLLDHYPPGMHAFKPGDVFQALYKDVCYQVSRTGVLVHDGSTDMILPSGFVRMVEGQLERCFANFIQGTGTPSATVHSNNLRRFELNWRKIRSDDTCLTCLRRKPEGNILPCGHSICENCSQVFGKSSEHDRWVFEIHNCFLCRMELQDVTVKVKPDNAGVTVLSVDGGGVRGIVPLQFLQVLQDRIGLPIPVQENFDIAFGTSSGGLIVLTMFINGWPVDDCANAFENLAKKTFKPRGIFQVPVISHIPILSRLLKFIISYLADGLYPADDLEAALKDVFGSDRGLLDYSYATAIGAKVGFTATTVLDTDCCIFTNYNGVGTRPQDCAYHLIQSKDGARRILLWEIARCGSAAPGYVNRPNAASEQLNWCQRYFRAKRIPGLGTFQDGAFWTNNPVDIALWEIPVVWPLIKKPHLIVSLGTGSPKQHGGAPTAIGSRGIWRDGFLIRSYRAFMKLLSGRKTAEAFKNGRRMDLKGRYYRFDTEFDGREPGLDETSKMQEIAAKAREEFRKSAEVDIVARCIIASYFHFELESKPKRVCGKYSGSGYILCRLPQTSPAFEVLLGQLSKGTARFFLDGHPIPGRIEDRSFIDKQGNFRKRVEFEIRDKMAILLKEGDSQSQHISGSPFSIDDLIDSQGFTDDFGRADHRKRRQPDSDEGPPQKRYRTR